MTKEQLDKIKANDREYTQDSGFHSPGSGQGNWHGNAAHSDRRQLLKYVNELEEAVHFLSQDQPFEKLKTLVERYVEAKERLNATVNDDSVTTFVELRSQTRNTGLVIMRAADDLLTACVEMFPDLRDRLRVKLPR
jgi:hypothetical protein